MFTIDEWITIHRCINSAYQTAMEDYEFLSSKEELDAREKEELSKLYTYKHNMGNILDRINNSIFIMRGE